MKNKPNPYEIATERILAALEQGVAPWRRPWRTTAPMSMSTNKPYRGVNIFLLMGDGEEGSNWWGTYKKITELGGQVRKGEKSSTAVYWHMIDGHDAQGNEKKIPLLRYFNVFNATQADWAEGLPEAFKATVATHEPIEAAERIVSDWKATGEAPSFTTGDRACYTPSRDQITMPHLDAFETPESYHSVMFHEMTHATGHTSRLAREEVVNTASFGSHDYGLEELVAEMGAAMLAGEAGITGTIETSAAYIDSWLTTIRGDAKLVVTAATKAQKAVDLILGKTWDNA